MPAPVGGRSTGTSNGSSASAGSRWSAGQRSGLANQTRLLSPTTETDAIAIGASTAAAAISQSAARMRRGR